MLLEAKNEQGNWVEIETLDRDVFCGTSARKLFLMPHQIIIAKLLRYHGNFKTTCRLRFGNLKWGAVYSNTFSQYIYKRMFENVKDDD